MEVFFCNLKELEPQRISCACHVQHFSTEGLWLGTFAIVTA